LERLKIGHWKLVICHVGFPDECDPLSRILGKSIATAKAARKPGSKEDSDRPLPMANDRFSMTNFQSRSPKSQRMASPTGLTQKSELRPRRAGG
jgi:hypothetical protein